MISVLCKVLRLLPGPAVEEIQRLPPGLQKSKNVLKKPFIFPKWNYPCFALFTAFYYNTLLRPCQKVSGYFENEYFFSIFKKYPFTRKVFESFSSVHKKALK